MACDDMTLGLGEVLPSPQWKNWAGNINYNPARTFRPTSRTQLVNIILQAEADGRRVKAFGSRWSFSQAAVTSRNDYLVDTSGLQRQFDQFNRAIRSDPATTLPRMVYVEAGIKVHELNDVLRRKDLAFPTLGGSAGQSIAGLIATGSHGGDFHLPPFADFVRAIHLVGTNGQEYWIERSERVTDPDRLSSFLPCEETIIEYDDELFNATVVSLGRMGIIYAMALEVVPAFQLYEIRTHWYWSAVSRELTMSAGSPDTSFTLPNGNNVTLRPLLTADWRFMSAVIVPIRDGNGDLSLILTKRKLLDEIDEFTSLEQCQRKFGTGGSSGRGTEFICNAENQGAHGIIAPFVPILRSIVHAADIVNRPWWAFIPVLHLFWDAERALDQIVKTVEDFERLLSEGSTIPIGEFLAEFINVAARGELRHHIYDLLRAVVFESQSPGCAYGRSYSIMDGYDPDTPCLYPVDAIEIAFDGSLTVYQDYISEMVDKIEQLMGRRIAIAGVFALRFTRQTSALLGIQQWPLTCHIELNMIQGLNGNAEFIDYALRRAQGLGGIPHWGMLEQLSSREIRDNFGNNKTRWRQALTRLAADKPDTFRSSYSLERDLEPLIGCRLSPGFSRFVIGLVRSVGRGLEGLGAGFRRLFSRG